MANAEVCRHCGEPILKFNFRDQGEQWWHANPLRGSTTYLHCAADIDRPRAAP
jgi:hypothetical protein